VHRLTVSPNRVNFMDITDYPHLGDAHDHALLQVPVTPKFQAIVNPLLDMISIDTVISTLTTLSNFPTRMYNTASGEEAVRFLQREYTKYAGGRTDITITPFKHSFGRQDSLIVRMEGEGPNADEVVILGGHVDSTSSSGNAPGADDDGSGSCTVLEVFRVLALNGFKAKRTIEFHGYAAEEIGLRGSQAIAQDYVNKGIDVFGMMQLDMTGYVKPGTTETVAVMTDFTNPALTQFGRALVETYTDIGWSNTRCGYACSDHASWNRAGYNTVMPAEGLFSNSNPNIHTSRDLIPNLNRGHMTEFAKLALAYVVEMSLAD